MTDTRSLEHELNQMILAGQLLEAFDKFYADDCAMVENQDAPRTGKAACRAYEEAFLGNVAAFHGATLHGSASEGDRSYSTWTFDMTFKGGPRMRNLQVAERTWRDGKVVHERFFYQPNVVAE